MLLQLPGSKTLEVKVVGAGLGKRVRETEDATGEPASKTPRLDSDSDESSIDALFEDDSDVLMHDGETEESEHDVDGLFDNNEEVNDQVNVTDSGFNNPPQTESDSNQNLQSSTTRPVSGHETASSGHVHQPGSTGSSKVARPFVGLALPPWRAPTVKVAIPTPAAPTPVTDPSSQDISKKKSGPGRPRTNPLRDPNELKRPRGRPRKTPAPGSAPKETTTPKASPQAGRKQTLAPADQAPKPIERVRAPPPAVRRPSNGGPQLNFCLSFHGFEEILINKGAFFRYSAMFKATSPGSDFTTWPSSQSPPTMIEDGTPLYAGFFFGNKKYLEQLCTPAVWRSLAREVNEKGDGKLEDPDSSVNLFIVPRDNPAFRFLFTAQVYVLMDLLQMKGLAKKVFVETIRPAWDDLHSHNFYGTDEWVQQLVESSYQTAKQNYQNSSGYHGYDWARNGDGAQSLLQLTTGTRPML